LRNAGAGAVLELNSKGIFFSRIFFNVMPEEY
jgi:hypothetical protein